MKIGVQPTAVACRKTPLRGRRARITGRPTKSSRREHNEGQRAIHCPKGRHHIVYPSVSLIVLHLAKITIKYRQEFFRLQTCPSNCIECSLMICFLLLLFLFKCIAVIRLQTCPYNCIECSLIHLNTFCYICSMFLVSHFISPNDNLPHGN